MFFWNSLAFSMIHGIFQERILQWASISYSSLPNPEIKSMSLASPALAGKDMLMFLKSMTGLGPESSDSEQGYVYLDLCSLVLKIARAE